MAASLTVPPSSEAAPRPNRVAKLQDPQFKPKSSKRRARLPFSVSEYKGIPIARARATGFPKPSSPKQRAWVDAFICDQRAIKFADPRSRDIAEQTTKDTGWYPRDLLVVALHGNGMTWDGKPKMTTPTARIYRTTDEALAAGVPEYLACNAKLWDTAAFWNPAADTDRLTMKSSGLYMLTATVWFKAGTAAMCSLGIVHSDGSEIARVVTQAPTSRDLILTCTGLEYFAQDEYARMQVYRDAGSGNCTVRAFQVVAITPETLT